jgi:uncharacterized protein YxjI
MATPAIAHSAFAHDRFTARRKVMTLFSPQFHFYDEHENMIGYLKQKAFKLKEDIRLYSDESMTNELLTIKARKILDFSSAYDVVDSTSQQKVGALKRRGWKSMLKDEWIVMDANDVEIGRVKEESALLATLRRLHELIALCIPQSYVFEIGNQQVGTAKQNFNPFVLKLNVDFSHDTMKRMDRRLVAAAVVLLLAIEGRQK